MSVRSGGLRKIGIHPLDGGDEFFIASGEATYTTAISVNPELDTEVVRYAYSSLTTPTTLYDYNVRTREQVLLKRDPVVGSFDPENYAGEFLLVAARDGAQIPVSLLYRRGFARDGSSPLLQYGYGAYGLSMDPSFSSARLSLVDRGFVFAIAHVRGGQEMGRAWYDAGRQLHKKNTFNDFIDVTRALVERGYAAKDKVFAMGGSAGGLLMGAIANMSPDDYRAIVAQVPFVDVVTTMLDDSIPLTTNEYDEWGDPNDRRYYDYMLSYSPYDNVGAQAYPAMFVTTGLWDSQVQYFEPVKWVAKLRAHKSDQNRLLLHVEMDAGHAGKAGRFQRYRTVAMEYAFLLEELGAVKKPGVKKKAPRGGEGEASSRGARGDPRTYKNQFLTAWTSANDVLSTDLPAICSGKPRGGGHASVDSGQGKLAIAAANHQSGLAAALGGQQRNDFRLHTCYA